MSSAVMESLLNLGAAMERPAPPPTVDDIAGIEFLTPETTANPTQLPTRSPSFVEVCEPKKDKGYASDCIGLGAYDRAYDDNKKGSRGSSTTKAKKCLREMSKLLCCRSAKKTRKFKMVRASGGVLA